MQQFMLYKASREERPRNHVLPKHPSLRSPPFLNVAVIEPNQMAYPALAPQVCNPSVTDHTYLSSKWISDLLCLVFSFFRIFSSDIQSMAPLALLQIAS